MTPLGRRHRHSLWRLPPSACAWAAHQGRASPPLGEGGRGGGGKGRDRGGKGIDFGLNLGLGFYLLFIRFAHRRWIVTGVTFTMHL